MFSNNKKISEKQMRRMMILPVFASGIFVIPFLSAKLFGGSVFPGLGLFFVLACAYVGYIYGIGMILQQKRTDTQRHGFVNVLSDAGVAGSLLLVLQVLRLLIRLAFYILLTMAILKEGQVPFMQGGQGEKLANLFVILPLLLVALYGANTNIEKQARIHEIIFWVMFIPFIIVILFGLREVDYSVFVPHFNMPISELMTYSYVLLVFLLPVENYLYLKPDVRGNRTGIKWVVFVIFLIGLLTLLMLGIYGVNGGGKEELLTIAIMRYIRLPFGVLERFDLLMIWFFMTGCFILVCNTLYYAGYLLSILCKKIKRIWLLFFAFALVVTFVIYLPTYPDNLILFICYGVVMDIPLSILMPLFAFGLKNGGIRTRAGR